MPSLHERKREVPDDFDGAAKHYDFLTGLDPRYRTHLLWSAERLEARPTARILDLCCGTGTSTEALRRAYPRASIVGLDASRGMLEQARQKAHLRDVEFVHGDASDPAAAGLEGPFDAILMAYGIRNVPDPDRCLANIVALLAPGGTLCLHEYSVAGSRRRTWTWDAVCYGIIVPSAKLVGSDTKLYRYLHESVRAFDSQRALEERMRKAGLSEVRTLPMDFWQRGILHSFVGRRPPAA